MPNSKCNILNCHSDVMSQTDNIGASDVKSTAIAYKVIHVPEWALPPLPRNWNAIIKVFTEKLRI